MIWKNLITKWVGSFICLPLLFRCNAARLQQRIDAEQQLYSKLIAKSKEHHTLLSWENISSFQYSWIRMEYFQKYLELNLGAKIEQVKTNTGELALIIDMDLTNDKIRFAKDLVELPSIFDSLNKGNVVKYIGAGRYLLDKAFFDANLYSTCRCIILLLRSARKEKYLAILFTSDEKHRTVINEDWFFLPNEKRYKATFHLIYQEGL